MARFARKPCCVLVCLGLTAGLLLGAVGLSMTAVAQSAATVVIASPSQRQVLQGVVKILGTADAAAFESAELNFAYAAQPSSTWFGIQESSEPVQDGELGVWDTGRISDGEYLLRLRVNTLDGGHYDTVVEIQVRNYTEPRFAVPSATTTPPPGLQVAQPVLVVPSPTAGPSYASTPTHLPPNGAALTVRGLLGGLSRGALAVAGIFILLGILSFRRRF